MLQTLTLAPTHRQAVDLSSLPRSNKLERENQQLHSILRVVVDDYNKVIGHSTDNRNP